MHVCSQALLAGKKGEYKLGAKYISPNLAHTLGTVSADNYNIMNSFSDLKKIEKIFHIT